MANVLIATTLADGGTVSASSAAAGLPASNLLTSALSQVWRSTSDAAQFIEIDSGTTRRLNFVGLIATNLSAAATLRVRTADTQANLVAAPATDSGTATAWNAPGLGVYPDRPVFRSIAGGVTARWVRIDISDVGNADGFYEAGRLIVARAWQPARNLSYGWQVGWIDESPRVPSLGGQVFAEQRVRRRVIDLTLRFGTQSDLYDNAFEIGRIRGVAGDVLIIRNPGDTTINVVRQTVYGLLTELTPIVNSEFDIFEWRARVEELVSGKENTAVFEATTDPATGIVTWSNDLATWAEG